MGDTDGMAPGRASASDDATIAKTVPPYVVQSADNALQLLRVLVERRSLRVSDAAELLGVVPSTAHRLLGTLCYRGFAVHEQRGGSYVPGPAVSAMTSYSTDTIDLRAVSRTILERLRDQTRETVSLVVLEGASVHFVDALEGTQSVRVSSRLGLNLPAHCTSAGKALLALLSREELFERYPTSRLVTRSPISIRTRKTLEEELDNVRMLGYATNFDEGDSGIGGVGVAVADGRGRPLVALAVAAPTTRLHDRRSAELMAGPLKAAALELQAALHLHHFPVTVPL